MKNILLTAINARFSHSNPALYYLREYVKDLNYEIKITEFDLTYNYNKIIELLTLENPDVICFSVYIWNTTIIKTILIGIKTYLPEVKIILGGPEVSYDPEEWLVNFKNIDYIICGYGEACFRHLLQNEIKLAKKIIKLDNPDFNFIPFPYTAQDLDSFKNKYIYYESSRGCSFKCIYCLSPAVSNKIEYKKIDIVKSELAVLLQKSCNCIKFVDRSFNINKDHSGQIWEYLISNYNKKVNFHFEIHPQFIDDKDIGILKYVPPDYFRFEIGIQSTDNSTLKTIKRSGDWNTIRQNIIKISNLKNIRIHLDLIAGLPGENLEIIKKSFNDVYDLKPDHLQLGFLKILKGTEIANHTSDYSLEYDNYPPYMILKNNWLGHDDLAKLHKIENALDTFYNTNKFKITIDELLNYFPTPFDMYESIVNFAEGINKKHFNKNWNQNAEFLLNFIKNNFNDKHNFFTDCIKYDFCLLGNYNHYPDFIKDTNLIKVKRKIMEYFKRIEANGCIKYNNQEFNLTEINQAAFLIPSNKDFIRKYLFNKDSAIFINKDKIIYFKE